MEGQYGRKGGPVNRAPQTGRDDRGKGNDVGRRVGSRSSPVQSRL